MRLKLEPATVDDAEEILALRGFVAVDLTERFGKGHWSSVGTIKGVLWDMRSSSVYVARVREKVVGTFRLAKKKPWAIDPKYFTKCKTPIYLLSMAVLPAMQGKGIGRLCMAGAEKLARAWPADALRWDAYDAAAGAGEFYRKCGMCEVGRVKYRGVALVYFE